MSFLQTSEDRSVGNRICGPASERKREAGGSPLCLLVARVLPALILLTSLPGRPTAAAEGEQKYKPAMSSQQLEKKARRLQALVETKIVREHGMIPMFVRAKDYQLPTAQDYKGAYRHRHLKGKTEAEFGLPPMHVWRAWENTATDTAYYLAAIAYKYRCTGDPKDLAICRRTFGALKYIYGLTAAKGERGRLCKPYGGVWSNQSSGDQTQCVLWGLAAYRSIAPPEDLAVWNTMMKEANEYNIRTEYVEPHGYFGWTPEMLRTGNFGDQKWSKATWSYAAIYLPQLYLAWQATGDPRFLRESQRWYDTCDANKRPEGGPHRDLYLPALLMEMDPPRHEVWRSMMLSAFRKNSSNILPDGTQSSHVGRSAIVAMGCATAQRWFPEVDMTSVARHILEKLDEDTFRFVRPGTKPRWAGLNETISEWAIESKLIDGDSLTAWLAAYWEGRWRGYW
ncbi:MAG: hypothetical protein EXQ58_03180 [Acidobacteria bacterium]|nr:hypothetical protein [Acidobacteriota bacterium]